MWERHPFVEFDGFNSSKYHINSGVPQDSNVGPLKYLFFNNDLLQLFCTDDLKICCSVSNKHLQNEWPK